VGQQDYDFFATGRPEPPPEPPVPAKGARGPRQVTDPAGRAVNQVGTPVEVDSAPAGPAAAPGYGAQPYHGEGFATRGVGWQSQPPASHAAPLPPGAYAPASGRPGTVLAAGIIGIVQGAFGVLATLVALFAVSAVESFAAGDTKVALAGVTGFVRLILVIALIVAVGYLVAGIGTVASKVWAGWTLLALESVGLLLGLISLVSGSTQTGGTVGALLDLCIPAAVVVLLVLPASRAWLQRRA
jgi:hypothetical protein